MDLNITVDSTTDPETVKKLIDRAFEFDFKCIAINTIVDSSKLIGKNISVPEPRHFDFSIKPTRNFRILNRLTAIIEDNIHTHHLLRHPATKKYDLLALQPVGKKVLEHVCSSLDVDIISLDLTQSLGYTLRRTIVGQAIKKGICFEISYAPCLRDQTAKRMVISNSQLLVNVSKGKNIIISSGAEKLLELRSVLDTINLGLLFGFARNQSEEAVRKNGQLVLSHAGTRNNTGCGFVSLTGLFRLPKHQGWIVKACKVPTLKDQLDVTRLKRKKDSIDTEDTNVSKRIKN